MNSTSITAILNESGFSNSNGSSTESTIVNEHSIDEEEYSYPYLLNEDNYYELKNTFGRGMETMNYESDVSGQIESENPLLDISEIDNEANSKAHNEEASGKTFYEDFALYNEQKYDDNFSKDENNSYENIPESYDSPEAFEYYESEDHEHDAHENVNHEQETGQSELSPKAVPSKNPVPFAPEPQSGSYWPIKKTKLKEGRLVSYETVTGKNIGNPSRKFLAGRTTKSGAGRNHVAIDLYGSFNEEVVACEDGRILSFKHFYTTKGGYPTNCLIVQHPKVIINYGEVGPSSMGRLNLKVGDSVKAGQTIAFIGASNMLHFETYKSGGSSTPPQRWLKSEPNPPASLLNPTKYLLFLSSNDAGAITARSSNTTADVQSTTQQTPVLGQKDWSKAIRINRFYSEKLGWGSFRDKINDFLLPYSGLQGVSLGEEIFAQAVSVWQSKQGFSEKDSDGIIGPATWKILKPLIPGQSTQSSDTTQPPPVTSPKLPAWINTLTPVLNKYRGDIPLDFLLGWIAVESFGKLVVTTSLNERGYFQIHPDESKMLKITDHNRLSTDSDFSISSGIALVRSGETQASKIAGSLGFGKGSDLYWHIVKLLHWLPGGVKLIVDQMISEGYKPSTWEEFKTFVITNKDKIEQGMKKKFKKVWDPLKGLNNVDKLFNYAKQFKQALKQNETEDEFYDSDEEADLESFENFDDSESPYSYETDDENFEEDTSENETEDTFNEIEHKEETEFNEEPENGVSDELDELDELDESDELDEHEFIENSVIPEYQQFIDEVNDLVKDWSKPVRLNRVYGNSLGWNKFADKINDLLLPFSGYENVSLGEEAFAQAVSNWQSSRNLSAKDSDGIIGPKTWRLMKPLIVSGTVTPTSPRTTIPPVQPPVLSSDKDLQKELDSNPNIKARYQTIQAYKKIRDSVTGWGISNPSAYIETSIIEWNNNTGVHVHFDRNFDGDPHRSYLNLKRLYQAKGISDPAGYFSANIVSITFFNKKTPGHKDLKASLNSAQAALVSSGNNYNLSSAWSFVPRTHNNNIKNLSNHALGKAIDINPSSNPHILSADEIRVINDVCKTVIPGGLLAESNPDVLQKASAFFQSNFNDSWINQQPANIADAAKRKRATLNKYASNGFMTLPVALVRGLQSAGLIWGGSWKTAKDFMHFELRNP